jgi:hypothetical protein
MITFTPVSTSDFPRLAPFFVGQPYELCEYSLPGILVWSGASYYPCAAVQGERVLLGAEYPGHPEYRHLLLPLGHQPEPGPEELAGIAREAGYPAYWFVPQDYLDRHGQDEIERFFQVTEQAGYHDYIYHVSDLAELKGNRYAKKRNLIKQFQRAHAPERLVFEPITTLSTPQCIAFLEEWCEQEGCFQQGDPNLECEMEAATNMLGVVEQVGSQGLLLRIDGVISALAVASPLKEDMVVLQFQKACKTIKGLYQYFDRECAIRLCKGSTWVNKESDMGKEGLAHAKRSYHPARMIYSYELRLR